MANVVLVKHPKNWGLNENLVIKTAQGALKERKMDGVELSIIFVGKKRAKDLNITYRNKDYIPQVLGFPMSTEADGDGMMRLGDIVICTQKLKYEAVFQHKSRKAVLEEWVRHGLENLLM
jgi:rRNA maturation RNase YbeY